MKKFLIGLVFACLLLLTVSSPVQAKTFSGEAKDPNALWLGTIKYLGNPAGYHFWFTPIETRGRYIEGHTYHNVYKFDLKDTTEWCGSSTIVPDREPYNLVATPGIEVYYKIYDVTMDAYVCGMEWYLLGFNSYPLN